MIIGISPQHAPQMFGVDDDQIIETLAAYGADQPFGVAVLPAKFGDTIPIAENAAASPAPSKTLHRIMLPNRSRKAEQGLRGRRAVPSPKRASAKSNHNRQMRNDGE